MLGYKCDICEQWFRGEPESKGYRRYIHHKNRPLLTINVRIEACNEGTSKPLDLCNQCVIDCLDKFKQSHNEDYPFTPNRTVITK